MFLLIYLLKAYFKGLLLLKISCVINTAEYVQLVTCDFQSWRSWALFGDI